MSTVNGQSVADREEHVGGTHPYFFFSRGTRTCGLWPVACGLHLRPVVRACGRDPPFFSIPTITTHSSNGSIYILDRILYWFRQVPSHHFHRPCLRPVPPNLQTCDRNPNIHLTRFFPLVLFPISYFPSFMLLEGWRNTSSPLVPC